jgi:hypothetical protein
MVIRKSSFWLLAEHTKTAAGYHGLNHNNDAIVMGCDAVSMQYLAAFRT